MIFVIILCSHWSKHSKWGVTCHTSEKKIKNFQKWIFEKIKFWINWFLSLYYVCMDQNVQNEGSHAILLKRQFWTPKNANFQKSIFEKILKIENWHQILSFDAIYYQFDMLHDLFLGKNVDFRIFTANQFFEKIDIKIFLLTPFTINLICNTTYFWAKM